MSRSAARSRRSRGGGAGALAIGPKAPIAPPEATADGLAAQLSSAYGTEVTPDEAREIARNVNEFLSVLEAWTKPREPAKEVDP